MNTTHKFFHILIYIYYCVFVNELVPVFFILTTTKNIYRADFSSPNHPFPSPSPSLRNPPPPTGNPDRLGPPPP